MRALGSRARAAIRAFVWQLLGFGIIFALLAIGIYRVESAREQNTRRIEVIERVEPIDVLRECLRAPKCRRLLVDVPRRARAAVRPTSPTSTRQPVGSSQEGSPAHGKEQAPNGARSPPKSPPPAPHAPSGAPPAPSLPSPTPPAPGPGNSGATPAAENSQGIRACITLAVSACLKVAP